MGMGWGRICLWVFLIEGFLVWWIVDIKGWCIYVCKLWLILRCSLLVVVGRWELRCGKYMGVIVGYL